MARADPKRDYYADLEVPQSADINEINKHFKKLALKYHPDRNPGREVEFNEKFQNIKSAQEILTDPVQRAKYDAERARLGLGYGYVPPRPGVPTRNPYTATSNFPPPPSRTNPRPPYGPTPSTSGANRYANFPRPHANGTAREESHPKASAFRAFENMNKTSHHHAHPTSSGNAYPSPPKPPRPQDYDRDGPSRKARTGADSDSDASHPGIHRTQSTRTSRQPASSGTPSRDDPVTSSASYFNAARADGRPGASRAKTTAAPPPMPQRAPRPDPLGQFKAQNLGATGPSSPRLSTPYATKGGEKTYFSSSVLGRSASVRTPSTQSPAGRHRSASPPRSRFSSDQSTSPTKRSTPSRPREHRTRSDAGLSTDTQSPSPQTTRQADGERAESRSSDERVRSGSDSPSFRERLARDNLERGRRKGHHRVYPDYEPVFQPNPCDEYGLQGQPASQPPPRDPLHQSHSQPPSRSREGPTKESFTFDLDEDTFTPTRPASGKMRSDSPETIDTQFSSEDWDGQFTSNNPNFLHAPSTSKRGSPTRGRSSPLKSSARPAPPVRVMDGIPPIIPPKEPIPGAGGQTSFSPAYWTETLKDHNWEAPRAPPSPARSGSVPGKRSDARLKGTRGRQMSKSSVKRAPASKAAHVAEVSDEDGDEGDDASPELTHKHNVNGGPERRSDGDSSAMDIDPATPPGPMTPPTSHLRHAGPPVPPRTGVSPHGRPTSSSGGKIDLDSLRTVDPLGPHQPGLADLHDLSATLPFESRPSSLPPGKKLNPRALQLPRPPKAPLAPNTVTQGAWEIYLATSQAYLGEWAVFNDKMLGHFNDRQRDVKDGMAPDWMGIVGEGEKGGYLKYMQGVEEDFRVRQHWDVAWDKHREAMRVFGRTRDLAIQNVLRLA
ncbi:MAG: hypothetical protein M1838_003217 [Thelocarpon superellum]|nr:MAG: hypothetical protein M1838_003217 [Thelocarpon superellum]